MVHRKRISAIGGSGQYGSNTSYDPRLQNPQANSELNEMMKQEGLGREAEGSPFDNREYILRKWKALREAVVDETEELMEQHGFVVRRSRESC